MVQCRCVAGRFHSSHSDRSALPYHARPATRALTVWLGSQLWVDRFVLYFEGFGWFALWLPSRVARRLWLSMAVALHLGMWLLFDIGDLFAPTCIMIFLLATNETEPQENQIDDSILINSNAIKNNDSIRNNIDDSINSNAIKNNIDDSINSKSIENNYSIRNNIDDSINSNAFKNNIDDSIHSINQNVALKN